MCKLCSVAYSVVGFGLVATSSVSPAGQLASTSSATDSISTQVMAADELASRLTSIATPVIKEPTWLADKKAQAATAQKAATQAASRIVTYDVITRGVISANIAEFKQQANATLNDGRGWSRLGVTFQEVTAGGQFTLALSEASQVPSFSPGGCDAQYSCRAGRYVIINQDRWLGATSSWNEAGGSLRDYRHMVINHETGHWLGHGHQACTGAGNPAPVMQQQSISLQGCTFNPWPTAPELWSSQLGIGV